MDAVGPDHQVRLCPPAGEGHQTAVRVDPCDLGVQPDRTGREACGERGDQVRAAPQTRRRTIARYELALEATRRPELRTIYDRAGERFRDPAAAILAAAGSPDPVRHGRRLVAFGEGVMFDAIVGAGAEPTLDDLRRGIGELLRGMLGREGA
ncbi:hypothetical protein OG884_07460 [Streptosporangium sp. NBC_01755]|uniref:hypothetical protein n=1 Tax=unclassified Streptosporangium TaxID=2632669 RepID=UPI002DDC7276|nr:MULTISPECIES: hypothetical protein [unclassified Streptosporangium]WSA26822.1 hypothetical protein OIE13_02690 [Streptosporangium sp. NBC_01810]WSD01753.1 hypothetical protein OG884_07460 [Streptosporangium sp. NBC_01755]